MSRGAVEILLVEDNPDDVRLTLRAFRKHQLTNHVQIVRDGAQALDLVFGRGEFADQGTVGRPRAILLDLKLPLVDGIEVLRQVKSDPRTRSIPVVVLTSSSEDPDIRTCLDLGANSYIVKPIDFDQFSEVVRQLGFYWLLLNSSVDP